MVWSRSFFLLRYVARRHARSFPTRRSSDLSAGWCCTSESLVGRRGETSTRTPARLTWSAARRTESAQLGAHRSEEHTSELQSHVNLVCRLLLEKKKDAGFKSAIQNPTLPNP